MRDAGGLAPHRPFPFLSYISRSCIQFFFFFFKGLHIDKRKYRDTQEKETKVTAFKKKQRRGEKTKTKIAPMRRLP